MHNEAKGQSANAAFSASEAAITGHLAPYADALDTTADANGISWMDFNAMRGLLRAVEMACEAARARAEGRHDAAERYGRWALWKLAEATGTTPGACQ